MSSEVIPVIEDVQVQKCDMCMRHCVFIYHGNERVESLSCPIVHKVKMAEINVKVLEAEG